MGTYIIQVLTTVDRREIADAIARSLVEARLAACVQVIGPIGSTYRWNGAIETSEEWLCLIKTTADRYGTIEEEIRRIHPYETPEILATPVVAGSTDYLTWLAASLEPEA